MPSTASLRRELSERNQQAAHSQSLSHELTLGEMPSVIFACDDQGRRGNFHTASWRNICANPQWARRLRKVHLRCRFDCYRVERTSSRAGFTPAEVQRLFTAHFFATYESLSATIVGG